MDGTGFLLFYLKLACHLVVSASFKSFGEIVGSTAWEKFTSQRRDFSEAQERNHRYWFLILI